MIREYNTYIIGAGFSVKAGLPLGNELRDEVFKEAREIPIATGYTETLYDNILEPDLENYLWYKNSTRDNDIDPKDIDLEDFISYLDIEHYLGLKGKDTDREEGNRSQILIRNLITKVIYKRQQQISGEDWEFYDKFAKLLQPMDVVITFNYDTIIETILERNKIPFRYHFDKYLRINGDECELDLDSEEVILLKMHGSIDWFSKDWYDKRLKYHLDRGRPDLAHHTIFSNNHLYNPQQIVKGLIHPFDPLRNIYKTNNLSQYIQRCEEVSESPLIINPSEYKILYLQQLREYWYGFYSAGMYSKNFVIIGYSLPQHDEYIRLPLFRAINNFQEGDSTAQPEKNKLKLIDKRNDDKSKQELKNRYRFLDPDKTEYYFNGLDDEILELLLK